jgi:hypothetical protein
MQSDHVVLRASPPQHFLSLLILEMQEKTGKKSSKHLENQDEALNDQQLVVASNPDALLRLTSSCLGLAPVDLLVYFIVL